MYGLLALSALHMISTGCEDPELIRCRDHYLDATLRAHRQGLTGLRKETADAACFASIILMVDTFAALHGRPLDPYEPPVSDLRIARGVRVVFQAAWEHIKDDPDASAMIIVRTFTSSSGVSESISQADIGPFSKILEDQAQLDGDSPQDIESDLLHVYPKALRHIRSIQNAVRSREHPMVLCRIIMSFAGLVPERLLDCVEERRPRALIILAHYFSLASNAREVWWIGESPGREAAAVRDVIPSKFLHLLGEME